MGGKNVSLCEEEEDCAFAFTVTERQEDTCNATSCIEPVVDGSVVAFQQGYIFILAQLSTLW